MISIVYRWKCGYHTENICLTFVYLLFSIYNSFHQTVENYIRKSFEYNYVLLLGVRMTRENNYI